MGVSRTWNGSALNYLDTLHGTVGSLTTQCAWIKPAALGTTQTIFGNRYDAGYAFQINPSNELQISFQSSGVIYYLTAPLTIAGGASEDFLQVGLALFVACNVTSATSPATADFYAGLTANSVALIGSDSAPAAIVNNGVQHVGIGINKWGLTPQDAFNGKLQRVGVWHGINLTITDLRDVAVCGATPPYNNTEPIPNLDFFYEITGSDPEPDSSITVPFDAVVVGTLPVAEDLCAVLESVTVSDALADVIAETVGPTDVLYGSVTASSDPADVIASTIGPSVFVEGAPPPPPPPPPTGDDFIPKACPEPHLGGTLVTITGTNFVRGQTEVFFNKPAEPGLIAGQEILGWLWEGAAWVPLSGGPSSAVVVFISSTQIQVTVPAWVTPSTLTIRTPGGSGTTTETFSCGMPSVSPSWWRNEYRPGDAGAVCDRCGFRYWLSELSREWTGLKVCSQCFENRHPQDFVRAVRDGKAIRDPRREQEPVFVSPGDITADDL
jgi:hypothetical protein